LLVPIPSSAPSDGAEAPKTDDSAVPETSGEDKNGADVEEAVVAAEDENGKSKKETD
jgi:hypothetical protein